MNGQDSTKSLRKTTRPAVGVEGFESASVVDPQQPASIGYDACYKMVLIGNSGVGKTSMCYSLARQPGKSTIATTGVDMLTKTYMIEGLRIMLQLWDTAGMERFATVIRTSFHAAKGVLLVYAVDDRTSFDAIDTRWRRIMEDVIPPHAEVPVFLIANKTDLVAEKHVVSKQEGLDLAASQKWYFHEACAIDGPRTEDLFMSLIRVTLTADRILKTGTDNQRGKSMRSGISLPPAKDVDSSSRLTGTIVKVHQEQQNSATSCYC